MKIAAVLLAAAVTLIPNSAPAVSVAYAASPGRMVAGILPHAPDPQEAQSFLNFILYGQGKRILGSAGLRYFKPLRVVSEI